MTTTPVREVALSEIVAANVRALCAVRGWHQGILAERLGVARITVGDRARGRTPWTIDEVAKLSEVFGVEVADLLARPKGFEPLTFWLGADHSITVWPTLRAHVLPWVAWCDCHGWSRYHKTPDAAVRVLADVQGHAGQSVGV